MNYWRRLFFNFFYLGSPPWDTGITPPELEDYIQNHPPGRALDLGCGTGTNTITLAKHGWEVTGVDFVGRAIRTARRRASEAGLEVSFLVDDVTRLEQIIDSFDLVLDIGCFHSLTQKGKLKYLRNLPRLLKSSGNFLLYIFFKEDPSQNSGLMEDELEMLNETLLLVKRQNGTERGLRPSAWLTYQKR